jgi:hypothetical protein
MNIVLIVLAAAIFAVLAICHAVFIFDEGTPAKDRDILEMLDRDVSKYDRLWQTYEGHFNLCSNGKAHPLPDIYQSPKILFLFPYYIADVGVVPIWYKSAKVIEGMFEEKIKGSKHDTNKRKKLGLD